MNSHDGQPCEKSIAVARGSELGENMPEMANFPPFPRFLETVSWDDQ